VEEILSECLENAINFGISAYDSSYVTLAQINNVPFVTSDQKLANKSFPKVKLIPLENY